METMLIRIIDIDTSKTTLFVKAWVASEKGEQTEVQMFMVNDKLADEIQKEKYQKFYHEMNIESGWIIGIVT